ncbi:MAG: FUSC family protein [Actinobacteria bacterium]|nr:FUSC family protein [Actinomycetota bacterium]
MAYLEAVAKSVFAIDWAKRRGWSAARRGVVVMVSLIVFSAVFDPNIGALASVAALYVGLQDRAADPPGYTVRVMVLQSALLGAVVLLAGLAGRAWLTSVVLVALAACAGLAARRDKAISRMFADLIAVLAFLGLSTVSLRFALEAGSAVLLASLLQTVTTAAAIRFTTDLAERRPVAAALVAVAKHLDDAQLRSVKGTGEAAAAAIKNADESVSRSDLSHDRRRALRKVIGDAEMLREEASALRARMAFDAPPVDDDDVTAAIGIASSALRAAATAMTVDDTSAELMSRRTKAIAALRSDYEAAVAIMANPQVHGSAYAIAAAVKRLIRHLRRLRDSELARSGSRRARVRSGLRTDLGAPRPVDIRAGIRLGLAAALGLVLAHYLGLSHGGWIAATTVALLRPDHRALTSDTVARSLGTGLGAILVVPLVYLLPDYRAVNVVMVGIMALLTYSITSANEGLYIIAITIETVFTRAIVGEDPTAVAIERVGDVLLGCAIAIVLLLALPLRHGRRLRREVAEYAEACAIWIDGLADLGEGKVGAKAIRRKHRAMVAARAAVQHGIDNRALEPLGPGLRPWLAHNLYTLIHDAARACGAVQMELAGKSPPATDLGVAVASARATASNLHAVALLLTDPQAEVTPGPAVLADRLNPADLEGTATDLEYLLAIAERESSGALGLVSRQPSTGTR